MTLPPLEGEARARLLEALAKVDAFSARVASACGADLACGPGCADCCQAGLRLRAVEAAYVQEGLSPAALGAPGALRGACPLLRDGRCVAYLRRPALCRTHGLPLLRVEEGRALIHHCPRNFRTRAARDLPPSLLLDEARLSVLLDAIDALYCRETGWCRGRVAAEELIGAGLQG